MVKMVTFAISNNSDGTSGENSDYNGIDEAKCGAITKMVTLITQTDVDDIEVMDGLACVRQSMGYGE